MRILNRETGELDHFPLPEGEWVPITLPGWDRVVEEQLVRPDGTITVFRRFRVVPVTDG